MSRRLTSLLRLVEYHGVPLVRYGNVVRSISGTWPVCLRSKHLAEGTNHSIISYYVLLYYSVVYYMAVDVMYTLYIYIYTFNMLVIMIIVMTIMIMLISGAPRVRSELR